MHVEYYPHLLDVIKSLKYTLQTTDPSELLMRRSNELSPLDINLSFSPVISEKTVEEFVRADVCTMCERRIGYKPDQFSEKTPKLPYLVLIHNSFKLSESGFYESPDEDQIFRNMIQGGLGCAPSDLLVREILRCYFGAADEKNPRHVENCLTHLREDIRNYKIKGILILGQAAALLFNNEPEKIRKLTGQAITVEGVPALICPGPNRIHFMNKNKMDQEKIRAEKLTILGYLKKFRNEIMGR